MENNDPINLPPHKEGYTSISLMIISYTIYSLTFFIEIFNSQLGISHSNLMKFTATALIAALGINVYGTVKGFSERRENLEMAVNGIVGNLIPIITAIAITIIWLVMTSSLESFKPITIPILHR